MNHRPLVLSLAVAAAVSGCGGNLLETKKIDYKGAAARTSPLEVPPDLTTPVRDDRYAVPDATPKSSATYSAYSAERGNKAAQPAAPRAQPDAQKMRVERAGSQRWLVVNQPADKLWPLVRDFWQEMGFTLNLEAQDTGILETDWAENRAKLPQDLIRQTLGKALDSMYSTGERDKFRTRLEKTANGSTEVYISHRGMIEVYASTNKDQTVWQPRPSDVELEAEMLGRLMVRLGAEEQRAKAMLTAVPEAERARLSKAADGSARLVVTEGFDRTWRRVGLALDRVAFTVEDRDRSQGVYFVRYVDPDQDAKTRGDEGVIAKVFSAFKSDKSKSAGAKGGAQYRIHVKAQGDAVTQVQVLTKEGGADKSESAQKILTLLLEQLK